jgi:hypothetical protein
MADITAGTGASSLREFRIGQALSKAINIYGRNIVIFTLIAGVIWLPVGLAGYFLQSMPPDIRPFAPLIVVVLALFLQPLSTAIILYGAFQDMRGYGVSLSESIARGLSRFPALLGLMVVMTLALIVGLMLLVVPGLILIIMWYVAVPVCVVERIGPIGSLGRSQELTKGHRWKLFGLYLLIVILGVIGERVFSGVGNALAGVPGLLIAQTVWQGFAQAIASVIVVVAYHDLRAAKEGIDIERIASVFD